MTQKYLDQSTMIESEIYNDWSFKTSTFCEWVYYYVTRPTTTNVRTQQWQQVLNSSINVNLRKIIIAYLINR